MLKVENVFVLIGVVGESEVSLLVVVISEVAAAVEEAVAKEEVNRFIIESVLTGVSSCKKYYSMYNLFTTIS